MEPLRLSNKTVVLTGGVGLIGQKFSEGILAAGGKLILTDADKNRLDDFKPASQDSENLLKLVLDINSEESIQNVINAGIKKFGRIDAVVNNAYPRTPTYGRDFLEVKAADFCKNIELNLGGQFAVSQSFIKYFLKQGSGNIINIASIYGFLPPRFEIYQGTEMTMPVEYSVIKSGLIALTKYWAKYLKDKKIRVNSLSPGGVRNAQHQDFQKRYDALGLNKGLLDPDDLVGTLVFLLSDESLFINGQNIVVDDGWSL